MLNIFKLNKRLYCFALSTCLLSNPLLAQHNYKVSRKLIRVGKLAEAVDVLDDRIAKYPADSEWRYQLAIARAQLGELDAAMEVLAKSIEMGITPGRVVADARDLLKPLGDVEVFKTLVESQKGLPVQGPMIGAITDKSVLIWLRTSNASSVAIQVRNKAGKLIGSGERGTSAESDFTCVVEVTGLDPDVDYSYSVLINGKGAEAISNQSFRTSPQQGNSLKFVLAFGGGAGYVTKNERMWDSIGTFNPRLLLLLGDNIYSDDPKSPQMQKFCYYRRQSPPPFRRLVARTPVYSIWDDHDFGTNDCSGGPDIDVPEWKRPVWEVFKQNWVNPDYGGGTEQPGCWYDFHVGNVHFIMLDGRYYRHHQGKTMLGPVQKAWLKKTVKGSNATFKVLASPVPWDYRTKGKSRDTWNGYQEERTEIFDFLADNKIEGVMLMSADRHRSDAWRIDRPSGYPLYEFNSSRLTNNHVHGTMKAAIFSYNKKQSFGLVEFDTTKADPSVTYTVVTIDGEKMHTLVLKRSQMK